MEQQSDLPKTEKIRRGVDRKLISVDKNDLTDIIAIQFEKDTTFKQIREVVARYDIMYHKTCCNPLFSETMDEAVHYYKVDHRDKVVEIAAKLEEEPKVKYAEINLITHVIHTGPPGHSGLLDIQKSM